MFSEVYIKLSLFLSTYRYRFTDTFPERPSKLKDIFVSFKIINF